MSASRKRNVYREQKHCPGPQWGLERLAGGVSANGPSDLRAARPGSDVGGGRHDSPGWEYGLLFAATLLLSCLARPGLATADQPPQYEPIRPLVAAGQIFGADDRSPVADTTKYPYSAVGRVVSRYGSTTVSATGTVIANNAVLTAAHVVFDKTLGWPDSVVFVPGQNGSTQPFGQANVTHWNVPKEYTNGTDTSRDIAVLTLDHAVAGQTGKLSIDVVTATALAGQTLSSAGYPTDLGTSGTMYLAPGPAITVSGGTLLEEIDTERGQSGSPVWVQTGSGLAVVAVVVGVGQVTSSTGQVKTEGMATYITPETYSWIEAAIASSMPSTPSGDSTPSSTSHGMCGAGVGQAVLGVIFALTVCFCGRRRPAVTPGVASTSDITPGFSSL